MAAHLARFTGDEGVLFVGNAQEKARVFRTEKRRNPHTGQPYPWLVRATAMANHTSTPSTAIWAVLPQVLQLVSAQCQALSERPRVRSRLRVKG